MTHLLKSLSDEVGSTRLVAVHVGTYHIICPDCSLGLELGAIPDLERSRAASWEEVGNLLPGEVLGLFKFHQQRIVFRCEFEFGTFGARRRFRHTGLSDDAGRPMLVIFRRFTTVRGPLQLVGRLIRQLVVVMRRLLLLLLLIRIRLLRSTRMRVRLCGSRAMWLIMIGNCSGLHVVAMSRELHGDVSLTVLLGRWIVICVVFLEAPLARELCRWETVGLMSNRGRALVRSSLM